MRPAKKSPRAQGPQALCSASRPGTTSQIAEAARRPWRVDTKASAAKRRDGCTRGFRADFRPWALASCNHRSRLEGFLLATCTPTGPIPTACDPPHLALVDMAIFHILTDMSRLQRKARVLLVLDPQDQSDM